VPNENQAAELLVAHLTGLGHKKFAWLGGNKGLRQNLTRRSALASALHLRGLELADSVFAEFV